MLGLAEWVEALICGLSAPRMGPCFQERPSGSSEGGPTPGHQKKGEWQIRSDEDVEHISFFFFRPFCSPFRFSYYNTQAHEMRRGSRRWKVHNVAGCCHVHLGGGISQFCGENNIQ